MQVKKFEAKSMKEALEMVKVNLGPEAIILSVRDAHKGFGLIGEKSVEVTAAVSEETLRKKKLAESKLREDLREKFHQIPAYKQKQFINRVYHTKVEERRELAMAGGASSGGATAPKAPHVPKEPPVPSDVRARLRGLRYADIGDESQEEVRSRGRERVRRAAEAAQRASLEVLQQPEPSLEISSLRSQVKELKAIVEKFQNMPQIPLSSHAGSELGLKVEFAPIYQRLCSLGLEAHAAAQMLRQAQEQMDAAHMKNPGLIESWIVRHLLHSVLVTPNPLQGRYHVFMGPSGHGKTSALVKMASHLVLKERHTIAIISLDTLKVGAAEQLRTFAQILNVPYGVVRSPEEWAVAEQKLKRVQHILVDAPGFSLSSQKEVQWLQAMLPPAEFNRTLHYVQAVTAREEDAALVAQRYSNLGVHDVICTKLDESAHHGFLFNFQQKTKIPIHSISTGPRIPEDFELASAERVVDLLIKVGTSQKSEAQS